METVCGDCGKAVGANREKAGGKMNVAQMGLLLVAGGYFAWKALDKRYRLAQDLFLFKMIAGMKMKWVVCTVLGASPRFPQAMAILLHTFAVFSGPTRWIKTTGPSPISWSKRLIAWLTGLRSCTSTMARFGPTRRLMQVRLRSSIHRRAFLLKVVCGISFALLFLRCFDGVGGAAVSLSFSAHV